MNTCLASRSFILACSLLIVVCMQANAQEALDLVVNGEFEKPDIVGGGPGLSWSRKQAHQV